MQIKSAHVTNFRSAEDTGSFDVGQVTCLVGKNEAGKSAILMALAALNPHPSTPAALDKERDYPRRSLTNYDELHGEEDAVAISTTWELDDDDIAEIEAELGAGILKSRVVTISRSYGHGLSVTPTLDFEAGLKTLYDRFGLDEDERATLASAQTSTDAANLIVGLANATDRQKQVQAHLTKPGSLTAQAQKLIAPMVPYFMYFSAYDTMAGAIQVQQVQQLKANGQLAQDQYRAERLFVEFLDYSGIPLEEVLAIQTYETFSARLQAASNNITDQILEYWTQNPDLSVSVTIGGALPGDRIPLNTGTIARARVHNGLHRVDTPFSERSAGFVWFFSFLVKLAQVKDEDRPVVLLLDEPGLTLHGKAQADLLRFFKEKLAPYHQVIYSTHSPFMVPADDLASVRIVEDQVDMVRNRRVPLGTKVRDDVLTRDPDTLFPLQGALGYEISQTLFIGKNTLLVEGPGDILYLQALSEAVRRRGRTGLDPRWTMCPAGGIDKIRPFVALFAGNDLNVAVLTDQTLGDRRKVEDLKRSGVLQAGHCYTVADFLDRPEADIEDLFDPEVYCSMVNDAYSLEAGNKLDTEKLNAADGNTQRLVKKTEAAFRVMPNDVSMFDHFTPASWLIRNPKALDGKSAGVTATLDRAEKVFRTFNALLA